MSIPPELEPCAGLINSEHAPGLSGHDSPSQPLTPFEQFASNTYLPAFDLAEQTTLASRASLELGATAMSHTTNTQPRDVEAYAESSTRSDTSRARSKLAGSALAGAHLEEPTPKYRTPDADRALDAYLSEPNVEEPPFDDPDNTDIDEMLLEDIDTKNGEMPSAHTALKESLYQQYLRDINKIPLLKPGQESELGHAVEAGLFAEVKLAEEPNLDPHLRRELETIVRLGKQATETLVNANLRFVVTIARKYSPGSTLHLLDLIQEGNLGLMHAVEKFDYTRGYKFSTYAVWWIRRAIIYGIFNQERTIRLPIRVEEKAKEVNKAKSALILEKGTEPTTEELSARTGVPPEKIDEFKRITGDILSFSKPVSSDEDSASLGEMLVDDEQLDPAEIAIEQLSHTEFAWRVFEYLDYDKTARSSVPIALLHRGIFLDDPRMYAYVNEHAELEPGHSYTFTEIGHFISRSRNTVARLDASGIKILRALARDFFEF